MQEAGDLTFVCVWVGQRYGPEYVAILRDMVGRNCGRPHRFLCVTERGDELPEGVERVEPAGLPGWWEKVALFRPGLLPEGRIVYLDLDVAIVGALDSLADQTGIIREFNRDRGYNSSVMVWDSGDHLDAWERFTPDVMRRHEGGGDQAWLGEVGGWPILPRDMCVSFKMHAREWAPGEAIVVAFHGRPKPHEIKDGWVPTVWRIGGLSAIPRIKRMNRALDEVRQQIEDNLKRDVPWFTGWPPFGPPRRQECLIVGSAPSVTSCLQDIKMRVRRGAKVVSMNGSLDWLLDRGIIPDSHVMLDSRESNVRFLKRLPPSTLALLASQCHSAAFEYLKEIQHRNVAMWHALVDTIGTQEAMLRPFMETHPVVLVGGGTTIGLRALYLAQLSGFNRLHVYGMDSCYTDDRHHAMEQPENDGEFISNVVMGGKTYRCSLWMADQAQGFNHAWETLRRQGCRVWVHGTGLIPDMCRMLNRQLREAA